MSVSARPGSVAHTEADIDIQHKQATAEMERGPIDFLIASRCVGTEEGSDSVGRTMKPDRLGTGDRDTIDVHRADKAPDSAVADGESGSLCKGCRELDPRILGPVDRCPV